MDSPPAPKTSVEEPQVLDTGAIYEAEFAYVFKTLGRLGVRGHEREDLLQEVFMRAFRNLEAYDRSRPLRPWLFGIALRVASDFRRLRRHDVEVGGDDAFDQAAGEGDPEASLDESRKRRLVWQALDQLRLDQRAMIVLHDIDGASMPEIVETLEIPLATGYSRLRLARVAFADAVHGLSGEPGKPGSQEVRS
jgi:RNA polymerase sigma-70 factor, ECF subfamily